MQTSGSSAAALDAMPPLVLRVTNLLAYAALVTVNVLSGLNVFGPSQADVSQTYHTPLTPAGWAFSIWGLIFGLQGAAVLYAAVPAGYQMHWKRAAVNSVGYGWQLSWLCEACWLMLFPRQTALSFVTCAALLLAGFGCIFATLRRLHALVLLPAGSRGAWPLTNPLLHLLYLLPTSLNAAWMSVASCLGLAVLAASQDVSAPHQRALAALLAGAVSAGGVLLVLQTLDVPYGLTVVWALTAIISAQQHVPLVRLLAELALAAVLMACGYAVWKQYRLSKAWDDGSSSTAAAMQESLLQTPASGSGGNGQ